MTKQQQIELAKVKSTTMPKVDLVVTEGGNREFFRFARGRLTEYERTNYAVQEGDTVVSRSVHLTGVEAEAAEEWSCETLASILEGLREAA